MKIVCLYTTFKPTLMMGAELICAKALRCLSSVPCTYGSYAPHYKERHNIYAKI